MGETHREGPAATVGSDPERGQAAVVALRSAGALHSSNIHIDIIIITTTTINDHHFNNINNNISRARK
jgi:hypothetical protein